MMLAASASGVSDVITLSSASTCSSTAAMVRSSLPVTWRDKALRLAVGGKIVLEAEKALAHIGERGALLLQAQDERLAPVDVGAAVEVVADPAGERRQLGAQRIGLVAEATGGGAEEAVEQLDVGVAQVLDGVLRAPVLVGEVDVLVGPVRHADARVGIDIVGDGDLDDALRQRIGEAERRVRGEHDAGAGPLPTRLEGVEVGRRGGAFDKVGEFLVGRGAVDEADALAQVAGALHAGAVHEAARRAPSARRT